MHDQSHGPIELLALGEGTMPAFVCQDPDTGKDESLDGSVSYPSCESSVDIGDEGDIGDGEVDQGRNVEEIADDVCH